MNGTASVRILIWPLAVSAARLETLRATLSPDEQARADRIKVEAVAREFVASRGMVRQLLASECGCEPRAISIGVAARGKPYLEHPSLPLAFNLSHSGGYCALAMGNVTRLGVDIEAIRPTIGDFASSVFSPLEAAQYAALDESVRMRTFFRGWVAKEAYLKATGAGLAGGLKSLELDLSIGPDINAIAIRGSTAELSRWQFRGFDVLDTIVGAVAVEASDPTIEFAIRFVDAEKSSALT